MAIVLIRGTGDVGSAIAHALFSEGHAVVLHDRQRPAHARRGMAFTDVLFAGKATLEGVLAKRAERLDDLRPMVRCRRAVPAVDASFGQVLTLLEPDVLIDARMRKHEPPEPIRGFAPITVALGPALVAGEIADIVVETAWGDMLGSILREGCTRPLEGEPRELAGHSRDRFVYAPRSGTFCTSFEIGAEVRQGEPVAEIDGYPLSAPLTGRLRGLSHHLANVEAGNKVIEIDPGVPGGPVHGLGERPRLIAAGLVLAIEACAEVGPRLT
jgi:xanthine dehydrogenase accessory factor